jgi:uncharacterized protein
VLTLRPIDDDDIPPVLGLNERNVEVLAPMDEAKLVELRGLADRFDVVDVDGAFGGFVITFRSGTPYESDYYSWFGARYGNDFYYLDRIVLHEDFRRHGLGSFVYDEMEAVAAMHHRLTLEVNVEPPNDVSLAFHAGRGFKEVVRIGNETKVVALMEKPL